MKRIVKYIFFLSLACILFACNNAPLEYDATINGKEILTPAAKDEAQINGASVLGVRPGKPVFYHVAVSGIKPITYAAEGLPNEVQIDATTEWITGRAPQQSGDYVITLL
ncbi:MAG: hypothetical protein WD577_11225 [Bacteroidales bacterium]